MASLPHCRPQVNWMVKTVKGEKKRRHKCKYLMIDLLTYSAQYDYELLSSFNYETSVEFIIVEYEYSALCNLTLGN